MNSLLQSHNSPGLAIDQGPDLWLREDYVSYTTTRDQYWNISAAESQHLHQQFQAQYVKNNPRPHHHE